MSDLRIDETKSEPTPEIVASLPALLNEAFFHGEIGIWNILPWAADEIDRLRAKLAALVEECAVIAGSHRGAGSDPGDPLLMEGYDEACRDIANAIRDRFTLETLATTQMDDLVNALEEIVKMDDCRWIGVAQKIAKDALAAYRNSK